LGGERYGGLTAQVEAGVDVGQFRLRPPAGGTGIRAGAILQVGMGAEFYIPLEGGRIFPFTVEAAYRLAQPLNPDAERIHSLMLNVGHVF
jgi:hypothetical protein